MGNVSLIVFGNENDERLIEFNKLLLNQSFEEYNSIFCLKKSKKILKEKNELKKILKNKEVIYYDEPNSIELLHKINDSIKTEYLSIFNINDEISFDWLRKTYYLAKETHSDIVISPLFYKNNDEIFYHNLDLFQQDIYWDSQELIRSNFINYYSLMPSFSCLSNRLYTKSLFRKALIELDNYYKLYSKIDLDIFNFVLFFNANKISNFTSGAEYIVNMADKKENDEELEERINSINNQFNYMKSNYPTFDAEIWLKHILLSTYEKCDKELKKKLSRLISKHIGINIVEVLDADITFSKINDIKTSVNVEMYKTLSKNLEIICNPRIKVVSFDIFDTLIVRPFYYATDLFYLLNEDFNKLENTASLVNFAEIRINAERDCRQELLKRRRGEEDITLDDIYSWIKDKYLIQPSTLDILKNKEQELELKFCYQRKSGKNLYELAKQQNKIVIACSDMYLPIDIIEKILVKNGYVMDKIYVSSETKLCKSTGSMFKFVKKDLGVSANSILHIGDNWVSDVVNAKKSGWNVSHYAKSTDLFEGLNPGIYSGRAFSSILNNGMHMDMKNAKDTFLGYRCAMALVANKIFDNPYIYFNSDSDYNSDPYFFGYFALGTYLYAVTDWLIRKVRKEKKDKVHFISRDGYLPMLAYKEFKKVYKDLPEDNYIYLSRKSMLTADISNYSDLYSISYKLNVYNYSPKKLIKSFAKYIKDEVDISDKSICKLLKMNQHVYSKTFIDKSDYENMIYRLGSLLDFEKIKESKEFLKNYFSSIIGENDLLFDIGYSGRCEAALSSLLGYSINSMYVHSSSDMLNAREKMSNFNTELFYDYRPTITGVLREHVFMKLSPSTIGYEVIGNEVKPVFEKYKGNIENDVITTIYQNAAVDFVRDMIDTFGEHLDLLYYRKDDLSFAFEHFLHYAKPFDRNIFSCLVFEDDFGLGNSVSALDLWNEDLDKNAIVSKNYIVVKEGKNKKKSKNKKKNKSRWTSFVDLVLPRGSKRRKFVKRLLRR